MKVEGEGEIKVPSEDNGGYGGGKQGRGRGETGSGVRVQWQIICKLWQMTFHVVCKRPELHSQNKRNVRVRQNVTMQVACSSSHVA